jgi:hypothetical protein
MLCVLKRTENSAKMRDIAVGSFTGRKPIQPPGKDKKCTFGNGKLVHSPMPPTIRATAATATYVFTAD